MRTTIPVYGVASEADFYRTDPTPLAAWRWAVLMGANTRTYKFALGAALLDLAAEGRDAVPLTGLAAPYAMSIARRLKDAPQAREAASTGETDFLTAAALRRKPKIKIPFIPNAPWRLDLGRFPASVLRNDPG